MRYPPKPTTKPGGPVEKAIGGMTDGDGDEAPAKKPKGAPRGHPFKKGGKHKHGGAPFPKRC